MIQHDAPALRDADRVILEAARALRRLSTRTTVIRTARRLVALEGRLWRESHDICITLQQEEKRGR